MAETRQAEARKTRRSLAIAGIVLGVGFAGVGYGLYQVVTWLEPPTELPPEAIRSQPGLQQFTPYSERRLLAMRRPTRLQEEPSAVGPDHPFSKTHITGRVFDIETGTGVAGAVVRIQPTFGVPKLGPSSGDGSITYTTHPDGSYAMRGIPPGTFDLDVVASGFTSSHSSFKKFSAVEDDDGFDVGLVRGGSLEGRVVTTKGVPIAGAQVYASAAEAISVHKGTVLATTGADGGFVLDPVDARMLHVYAAHPRYGSEVVSLPAADSPERHVQIALRAARLVRGHVRDVDGPVAGAHVSIGLQRIQERLITLAADSRYLGVTTDRDGAFELAMADGDPVVLLVRAAGYEQTSQVIMDGRSGESTPSPSRRMRVHGAPAVDVTGSGSPGRGDGAGAGAEPSVRDVEIVLESAFDFRGEVLGADGKPAIKAEVSVVPATARGQRASLSSWTDDQGHFLIEGVPKSGPYTVTIRHFAHPVLTTSEDDVRGERRYRLEPQGRILGCIVDAATGRPVTRYQYSVSGAIRRQASAVSVSGAFEVDQLPAGSYSLSIEATGYESSSIEAIAVGSGETVSNLVVRMNAAGTIVGRVRGPPIAGVLMVHAWDNESRLEAEAVVGDDGGFSFNDLPSGTYTLTAFGEGDQGEIRGEIENIHVDSGGVTKDIEIVVSSSKTSVDPG